MISAKQETATEEWRLTRGMAGRCPRAMGVCTPERKKVPQQPMYARHRRIFNPPLCLLGVHRIARNTFPQGPWSPHAAHDPQSTIPQPPDAFKFHLPPRPAVPKAKTSIRISAASRPRPLARHRPKIACPCPRVPSASSTDPAAQRHSHRVRVGVGVLGKLGRLGRGLAPPPKHELDVVRTTEHGPVAVALSSPCGGLGLGLVFES